MMLLNISNIEVYGLKQSIVASGYPYRTEKSESADFYNACDAITKYTFDLRIKEEEAIKARQHLKRGETLANAPSGSGHDNFLKGVIVQYDLTAPEYFWRQFDRYHFHDYISSQSKMHRLLFMELDKSCNKYVSQNSIDEVNKHINAYNNFNEKRDKDMYIYLRDGSIIPMTTENLFQLVISNCPMGLELTARITDNYLQLKSKYKQRKSHKLEEWRYYCGWIKTLPMAKELIIGD